MEKHYDYKEVCNILCISRATLYRKVKSGEIEEPLRNGSRLARWTESSITRYQETLKCRSAA